MKLFDFKKFLIETSREVQKAVKPILGTDQASKPLGRGAGGDITVRLDKLAEDTIINSIKNQDISCKLVSEECGTIQIGDDSETCIVIDSIDGTTNSLRNIPFFCTSIAISKGSTIQDVQAGVVLNLYDGSIFYAQKNKGAYKEDRRIRTSDKKNFEDAVFGIDISKTNEHTIRRVIPILERVRHVRHLGATALEICFVASGFMDAYVDIRGILRVTDIAASYIILKEAGGEIVSIDGKELETKLEASQRVTFIAASNSIFSNQILELISK